MGHITVKWVLKLPWNESNTYLSFFFFESNVNRVVDKFSGRSYETMEIIGPQMVLTMKMITFGWNVYDGRRKVEVRLSAALLWTIKPSLKYHLGLGRMASCKKDHKIPILTWISWILVRLNFPFRLLSPQSSLHVIRFYFPGILVGPYIDFPEYMELIDETTFQNAQVKAKLKPGRRLPPGRIRAAYTKLFFGLVYLVAFLLYNGKYNYRVALKPEFMKHSLLMRYVFIYLLICQGQSLFLEFCYSSSEDHLNEWDITLSGHLQRYTYFFPLRKLIHSSILSGCQYPHWSWLYRFQCQRRTTMGWCCQH